VAQRIGFHYIPGTSLLHRWDARCRLLGLLAVAFALLRTDPLSLLFCSGLLLGGFVLSRLPLRTALREFRSWMPLLLVLFGLQAFFGPGTRPASAPWLPVTREGLLAGAVTAWRVALLLGFGALFTAVTRPREVQDGIVWFLRPLPFLPGRRIGLMVSLTLRFFAVILDQAEEVRLAHRARLGDLRRNPLRRIRALALPILRRSFSRAEEVTLALASRGYRDDLPLRLPPLPPAHLIPLGLLAAALLGFRLVTP
jgi:biotin transport system permease protein